MISRTKMLLIVVLFVIAITGIRLTWLSFQKTIDHPQAVNGILDLRGWQLPADHTIPLNGQWEFFPSRLLTPKERTIQQHSSESEKTYIEVPGDWKNAFSDGKDPSFRYGTYRLQILLDDPSHPTYKLRINEIRNASAVYVNGRLYAEAGQPATKQTLQQARNIPYSVTIPAGDETIEIVIQASNHAGKGGITQPIRFGTIDAVDNRTLLSAGLQFMLCVVLCCTAYMLFSCTFWERRTEGCSTSPSLSSVPFSAC
ncbi:hypothetical protein [Brevibacillus humidisoli]|uniref:hypothetical protein n=1 Tax=Brevibacillus humidisoli TaxID=2895522 RepID=UPI0030BA0BB7